MNGWDRTALLVAIWGGLWIGFGLLMPVGYAAICATIVCLGIVHDEWRDRKDAP